jgi:hypothetical protein
VNAFAGGEHDSRGTDAVADHPGPLWRGLGRQNRSISEIDHFNSKLFDRKFSERRCGGLYIPMRGPSFLAGRRVAQRTSATGKGRGSERSIVELEPILSYSTQSGKYRMSCIPEKNCGKTLTLSLPEGRASAPSFARVEKLCVVMVRIESCEAEQTSRWNKHAPGF